MAQDMSHSAQYWSGPRFLDNQLSPKMQRKGKLGWGLEGSSPRSSNWMRCNDCGRVSQRVWSVMNLTPRTTYYYTVESMRGDGTPLGGRSDTINQFTTRQRY